MTGVSQVEGDLYFTSSLSETVDWSLLQHIDPDWIEQALEAAGAASVRRRRLPAEQVLWLVIGMAMMRSCPIHEVVSQLDLVLPGSGRRPRMAKSAISQARARLGDKPVRWLFEKTAKEWSHKRARADEWRGLALYGVDGTGMRTADSDANREHFGLVQSRRGPSGYPVTRVLTVIALRSHLMAAATFGPWNKSEHALAQELWEQIPDNSLTIVDRGFAYGKTLVPLQRAGEERHWLTRARKDSKWEVVEELGPTELLVRVSIGPRARRNNPELPKQFECRAIHYSYGGREPSWLLTSLVDHEKYPRDELVAMYHERWEHELAYDELKTEMLCAEETLRSKTVEGTCQELWGILLAYNLVRLEMTAVADEANVPAVQVSFAHALRHLILEWTAYGHASPGSLPSRLRKLREDLRAWVLPARRSKRSYPRAVKIKMSRFAKKPSKGGESPQKTPK